MAYRRAANTQAFTWNGTAMNTFFPPKHLQNHRKTDVKVANTSKQHAYQQISDTTNIVYQVKTMKAFNSKPTNSTALLAAHIHVYSSSVYAATGQGCM
jgi:hypothetical protein